jgi:hypothetical protein
MKTAIVLAVEDVLSEAVASRLLALHGLKPASTVGLKGASALRARAVNLNRAAQTVPVFLLTDLDTPRQCPASIVQSWIGTPSSRMLFRVAVMEVESWLLADSVGFTDFARLQADRVPSRVDEQVADPKRLLVNLVRKSRDAQVRRDIVPADGSTALVGVAYNARLTEFVFKFWNPERAASRSTSLHGALVRTKEWAATL